MNTIDIKYCAQDLRFTEDAHKLFETYEGELKHYFLEQADGYEIFEDLKLRLCEMLQSKMKSSGGTITTNDIEEIKNSVGDVKQLEQGIDENETFEQTPRGPKPLFDFDKKLYRNESDKLIGGVCGGLGNYFSIDPLAFRILFVLLALVSSGVWILAYAVLWIVLRPKELPTNLTKRLFRNTKDQVIAGVCGGLSVFFNIESWVVRVLFLSPLIVNILTSSFNFGFTIFNGSALGLSIILYITLWITTKPSETPTEDLLSRGEDITINSISEQREKVNSNPDTNSGFNNVLRVLAFILIAFALLFSVCMALGLSLLSIFMWPMTSAILQTTLLKWLGALSVIFFIVLPLVAFIVWAVRRISGVKGPNKTLRTTFGGLWGLGFTSAIVFSFLLFTELKTSATVNEIINLPVQGDTLYVNKLMNETENLGVRFSGLKPFINSLYYRDDNEQQSNMVTFKKRESEDGTFYIKIEKTAQGSGKTSAMTNARMGEVKQSFSGNELKISKFVSLPATVPYRFQHARVTFYVPKGKELVVDPTIKKFKKKKGLISINTELDNLDEETKEEISQEVEEAMEEVGEAMEEIGEAMEEVGISIEKAGAEIGDVDVKIEQAEKESKAKMEIEKQKLRIRKEQLHLEKLQEDLEKQE